MVGVNGLCWKLKGEYQEPADLSRICGQKHIPVLGIGCPQFHTVTKGDNGSSLQEAAGNALAVAVQRKTRG